MKITREILDEIALSLIDGLNDQSHEWILPGSDIVLEFVDSDTVDNTVLIRIDSEVDLTNSLVGKLEKEITRNMISILHENCNYGGGEWLVGDGEYSLGMDGKPNAGRMSIFVAPDEDSPYDDGDEEFELLVITKVKDKVVDSDDESTTLEFKVTVREV